MGNSLSALPAGATSTIPPWAQRQQRDSDGHDAAWTARVQLTHPRSSWWWGQRTVGNVHGAWCYLCERLIVTWARAYPMTAMAHATMDAHRREHIDGTLPSEPAEAPRVR